MAAIDELHRHVRDLGTRIELLSDVISEMRCELNPLRGELRSLRWWVLGATVAQIVAIIGGAAIFLIWWGR